MSLGLDRLVYHEADSCVGEVMVKRAYRFRFYPDQTQADILARTFGCARFAYNRMLLLRTNAWRNEGRSMSYHETSAALTALKKAPESAWLNEVSSVPVQQALRHLQAAFANFFAKRAGYPTARRKDATQAAEYTRSGFRWDGKELRLAKMAQPLAIRFSRQIPTAAKPSSVTVSRDTAGRYFVSLLCAVAVKPLMVARSKAVGVDLGLTTFATLSTGEKIQAPRAFRKNEVLLARRQRELARKRHGSIIRGRAKLRVARMHARISDVRRDFLHKLSTRLIRENQAIAVESLEVRGMQQNRRLAKSLADAGWAEFVRQLEYKAAWYGRELTCIDRWYPSSKRCAACGHVLKSLPLSTRAWMCPECGAEHDRDVNAARNILAAGLAASAHGECVSPVRI
jgi:putative transposase